MTTFKYAYLAARDIASMRQFYAALGLPVRFQDGTRWCQFDGGRADFALSSEEEAHPAPGGTVAVFQVPDLAAAQAGVRSAGGRVVAQRDMGAHGQVLSCVDIEGNFFQLFAAATAQAPGAH